MGVTVRFATVSDAGEIARVHVESWRGAYRELLPAEILGALSIPARTEQWRGWLAPGGPRVHTLVAERQGELLGFATMTIPSRDAEEPGDVGEVPALYVAPAAWREGAGATLISRCEEELRLARCREGILWMLEGNERADAFYRSQGWRHDGGRRGSQYFPDVEELVEVRYRRELGTA
jgi:GNAT superfamily N-acetyltransferase